MIICELAKIFTFDPPTYPCVLQASESWLPELDTQPLIYAGYALARNGSSPSMSWQMTFRQLLDDYIAYMGPEDFPMLLTTLALWKQQDKHKQQQQRQAGWGQGAWTTGSSSSSSSSTYLNITKPWLDSLLLASHKARVLQALPLAQVSAMVKALGALGVSPSDMWLQRVWQAVPGLLRAAKATAAATATTVGAGRGGSAATAAAAARSATASECVRLLSATASLVPLGVKLPSRDWVDEVLGYCEGGLGGLGVQALSDLVRALEHLGHIPDGAFVRQLQHVVVKLLPKQQPQQWPVLLAVGLWSGQPAAAAVAGQPAADAGGEGVSSSSSSSIAGVGSAREHLHVLSEMVTVADKALTSRATAFEQDGAGCYVVPQALLECAAIAAVSLSADSSSSSSSRGSVHQAEEEAVAKLRHTAVKAVAVVGQSMTPWQLLDSLDILTGESMALTSKEVEQLLQSVPNVGSTSQGWAVADNAELLQILQKVGATPSRELLQAVAGQLKDVAAAVAKRSRAKKPETKAKVLVPCNQEEALGLLQLLQKCPGGERLVDSDMVGVLQNRAKWQ
jgi:hypothetical protein